MSEEKRKRPTYSPEFKTEAVVMSRKKGIPKASQELGISPATLRSWVLKAQGGHGNSGAKPTYEDLEKEVARLRKEIGYINEINKVLKKSTAIFSSKELGGLS